MKSIKYKNWKSFLDLKTCLECRNKHGKVYLAEEKISPKPPIHFHCRCVIEWLKAVYAGTATNMGDDGADWWLSIVATLPDYYITQQEAEKLGYRTYLGNLSEIAPGKMLSKGVYQNRNGHLPSVPGRICTKQTSIT